MQGNSYLLFFTLKCLTPGKSARVTLLSNAYRHLVIFDSNSIQFFGLYNVFLHRTLSLYTRLFFVLIYFPFSVARAMLLCNAWVNDTNCIFKPIRLMINKIWPYQTNITGVSEEGVLPTSFPGMF